MFKLINSAIHVLAVALTSQALVTAAHARGVDPVVAGCIKRSAAHWSIDADLLKAIAKVESGFNPRAINRSNLNGSYDIGLMQINSWWLPRLARSGVTEQMLFDPCTNAHVGGWVLAQNFASMGVGWNAVGAYNAVSPAKRQVYISKVQRAYIQVKEGTVRTAERAPSASSFYQASLAAGVSHE